MGPGGTPLDVACHGCLLPLVAIVSGKVAPTRKRDRAGENPRLTVSLRPELMARVRRAACRANLEPGDWVRRMLLGLPDIPLPKSFAFPQVASALSQLKAIRSHLEGDWSLVLSAANIDGPLVVRQANDIEMRLQRIEEILRSSLPDSEPET